MPALFWACVGLAALAAGRRGRQGLRARLGAGRSEWDSCACRRSCRCSPGHACPIWFRNGYLLCLALCRHHPSSFLSSNVLSAPPPDAPRGRHRHHAGHARPQAYPPPTHAAVGRWRRRIGGCAHGSARGDRPGTDAACRVRPSRLGLRLGAWEAYLLLRAVVCSIFNCACRVRALCFFWGGGQGGDGDGIARRRRRGWWASFFLLIDSADCVTLSCWPPQ